VVFRENSQLSAFSGGRDNEVGGLGEVLFGLEGLRGVRAIVGGEGEGERPQGRAG
jgi:hypothetical protein